MNDVFEHMFLNNFTGTGEVWIGVAYVVCMFAIAAFRPQQIGNRGYFRMSYLVFALYFILPALANAVIWWVANVGNQGFGGMRHLTGFAGGAVMMVAPLLAKGCLGASIVLGLSSLRHTLYMPSPYRDD